jgi:hypothetical protein
VATTAHNPLDGWMQYPDDPGTNAVHVINFNHVAHARFRRGSADVQLSITFIGGGEITLRGPAAEAAWKVLGQVPQG